MINEPAEVTLARIVESRRRRDRAFYARHKLRLRERSRAYAKANPERVKALHEKHMTKCRNWLADVKARSVCVECGQQPSDLAKLHFHHVNPDAMSFRISSGAGKGYRIGRLEAELLKCVPMCDTCHSSLHCAGYRPEPVQAS